MIGKGRDSDKNKQVRAGHVYQHKHVTWFGPAKPLVYLLAEKRRSLKRKSGHLNVRKP